MRKLGLRFFTLVLTVCAPSFSQSSINLTGNWQLTVKSSYHGGSNFTATLDITQEGNEISGIGNLPG
jgi:hypothetical protein